MTEWLKDAIFMKYIHRVFLIQMETESETMMSPIFMPWRPDMGRMKREVFTGRKDNRISRRQEYAENTCKSAQKLDK